MKTRVIYFIIFTLTLCALGTVLTLLFNWQPKNAEIISAFFLSFFLLVGGGLFMILSLVSYWRYRTTPAWQSTLTSARWSILLAGFLSLALLLRSYRLWNLATGITLAVVFIVLDLLWRRRLNWKKIQP